MAKCDSCDRTTALIEILDVEAQAEQSEGEEKTRLTEQAMRMRVELALKNGKCVTKSGVSRAQSQNPAVAPTEQECQETISE